MGFPATRRPPLLLPFLLLFHHTTASPATRTCGSSALSSLLGSPAPGAFWSGDNCASYWPGPAKRGAASLTMVDTSIAVLFGGTTGDGAASVDGTLLKDGITNVTRFTTVSVIDLDTEQWRRMPTTGTIPSARSGHTALAWKDATGKPFITIFGGESSVGVFEGDGPWQLDLRRGVWSNARKHVANSVPQRPAPRKGHTAVLYMDGVDSIMAVFGGLVTQAVKEGDASNGLFFANTVNDGWRFNLNRGIWEEIEMLGTVPGSRMGHTSVVWMHPTEQDAKMTVYGGRRVFQELAVNKFPLGTFRESYGAETEIFTITLCSSANALRPTCGVWLKFTCDGIPPPRRAGHQSLIWWQHHVGRAAPTPMMTVFGGAANNYPLAEMAGRTSFTFGTEYNDVHILDLAAGNYMDPTWQPLDPEANNPQNPHRTVTTVGRTPQARHYHSAVAWINGSTWTMSVFGGIVAPSCGPQTCGSPLFRDHCCSTVAEVAACLNPVTGCTVLPGDVSTLITGGVDVTTFSDLHHFDLLARTWRTRFHTKKVGDTAEYSANLGTPPTKRWQHIAVPFTDQRTNLETMLVWGGVDVSSTRIFNNVTGGGIVEVVHTGMLLDATEAVVVKPTPSLSTPAVVSVHLLDIHSGAWSSETTKFNAWKLTAGWLKDQPLSTGWLAPTARRGHSAVSWWRPAANGGSEKTHVVTIWGGDKGMLLPGTPGTASPDAARYVVPHDPTDAELLDDGWHLSLRPGEREPSSKLYWTPMGWSGVSSSSPGTVAPSLAPTLAGGTKHPTSAPLTSGPTGAPTVGNRYAPSARYGHSAVVWYERSPKSRHWSNDPKMTLFGGTNAAGRALNDCYTLDLITNVWSKHGAASYWTMPSGRRWHTALAWINPITLRPQMTVYGGLGGFDAMPEPRMRPSRPTTPVAQSDTYTLDLIRHEWQRVPTAGGEPETARYGHVATLYFDHSRPKMAVVGGNVEDGNDILVLDLQFEPWGQVPTPTQAPTNAPSVVTAAPSSAPTSFAYRWQGTLTWEPTGTPTTVYPTKAPTVKPSSAPTAAPIVPSNVPSAAPTAAPSTGTPTALTARPTTAPFSSAPSAAPTSAPTEPPTIERGGVWERVRTEGAALGGIASVRHLAGFGWFDANAEAAALTLHGGSSDNGGTVHDSFSTVRIFNRSAYVRITGRAEDDVKELLASNSPPYVTQSALQMRTSDKTRGQLSGWGDHVSVVLDCGQHAFESAIATIADVKMHFSCAGAIRGCCEMLCAVDGCFVVKTRDVTISGMRFRGTSGATRAGVIVVGTGSAVTAVRLEHLHFASFPARAIMVHGGDGGAGVCPPGVRCKAASVEIVDTRIANCSASGHGGGMLVSDFSAVVVEDSTFAGNVAYGPSAGGGGIAVRSMAQITLRRVQCAENEASYGGCIDAEGAAAVRLDEIDVRDNMAHRDGGGARFVASAVESTNGTTFRRNSARRDGGAILFNGEALAMFNSTVFRSNRAMSGKGGAFRSLTTSPAFHSCTFEDNRANVSGGLGFVDVGAGASYDAGCVFARNLPSGTSNTSTPCPIGYASSVSNRDARCEFCAPGKIAATPGMSLCDDCARGAKSNGVGVLCEMCAVGKFALPGSFDTCEPCPWDEVSPSGSHECLPCVQGTVPDRANSMCVTCAVGKYAPSRATTCFECGKVGMDCTNGILKLKSGWWFDPTVPINRPHRDLNTSFRRAIGHIIDADYDPGWATTAVTDTVLMQGMRMEALAGQASHLIQNNSLWERAERARPKCNGCPIIKPMQWEIMGYEMEAWTDLVHGMGGLSAVFPCLNPRACHTMNQTIVVCADHAAGPLCGHCEVGFVPDLTDGAGRCNPCSVSGFERWVAKLALIGACGVVLFLLGVFFATREDTKLLLDSFLMALNVRRIVRKARKRALLRLHDREVIAGTMDSQTSMKYRDLLDDFNIEAVLDIRARRAAYAEDTAGVAWASRRPVGWTQEDEWAFHDSGQTQSIRGYLGGGETKSRLTGKRTASYAIYKNISPMQMKIVMYNLQIVASLAIVFSVPWPQDFYNYIEFLNIFKLDIFRGLAWLSPCMYSTHAMSLVMFTLTPTFIIFSFALAYAATVLIMFIPSKYLDRVGLDGYTLESSASALVRLTTFSIFFIYPSICSQTFMTFKCVELNDGVVFLVSDMTMECYTGDWLFWCGLAVFNIIFFVIGIPAGALGGLLLLRSRGTLHFPEADLDEGSVMDAADLVTEYFSNRKRFGNLYQSFKPKYWWFEFTLMFRKFMLCGALALYSGGKSMQVLGALGFSLFWLQFVTLTKPCLMHMDNRLLQIEACQVLITLTIGLVLQAQSEGSMLTAGMDHETAGVAPLLKADGALSFWLIIISLFVVAWSVLQQPILLIIANIVWRAPQRFIAGRRSEKMWQIVWRKRPLVEDYNKAVAEMAGTVDSPDIWCDDSLDPPEMIPFPQALWLKKPILSQSDIEEGKTMPQSYYVDHTGKVVLHLVRSFTPEGKLVWTNGNTMELFDGQPMELFPAPSFVEATHWLHTVKLQLLQRPPVLIVTTQPGWRSRYDAIKGNIWRNRKTNELRRKNPAGLDIIGDLLSEKKREDKDDNFNVDESKKIDPRSGQWVFKPMYDDGDTTMRDNPQTRAAALALEKVKAKRSREKATARKEKRLLASQRKEGARLAMLAQARPERRVAPDGGIYTHAEFVEHYGGTFEWTHATPEVRISPDGLVWTLGEFAVQYHGVNEWDAAESETRLAPEGNSDLTRLGFEAAYGSVDGLVKWDAAEPKKRVATDGNAYSREEFLEFFSIKEYRAAAGKDVDVMAF